MANPGDTKERFGRSYIYLIPSENNFEPGTWRLRVDDNGTPPIDGGGGGEADLSSRTVVAADETAMSVGQLVYVAGDGTLRKAVASDVATADVAGMVIEAANPGEICTHTRNEVKDIFNVSALVDGAPGLLTPGASYYLSAVTPGNWTILPDTTTAGAVVRVCGYAIDTNKMAIEISNATVI